MLKRAMLSVAMAGLALGAGFAAPDALSAQDTVPEAQAPAAQADGDKQICKRVATTGSRVGGQRICKSAAEWDDDARAAQAAAREIGKVRSGTKGQ